MSEASKTEQDVKPYARCNTCGVDLPTQSDQREHMSATMEATGELGITARSHSTTVINPTPDEVKANRVRSVIDNAMGRALSSCCEDLDDEVRRGRVTEEQITRGLQHYPDFSDAWAEWVAG